MNRMSAAEYRAMALRGRPVAKYRNVRTEYGGRTYDSKLEAAHAAALDLLLKAGKIAGWIPQVSIPVPGTTKRMMLDFLVLMPDGTVRWQDTKGPAPTRDWMLKRELVETGYGIKVEIVRTAGALDVQPPVEAA